VRLVGYLPELYEDARSEKQKHENSFSGDGKFKSKCDLSKSTLHTAEQQITRFAKSNERFRSPFK
jgi:hypothetical protein